MTIRKPAAKVNVKGKIDVSVNLEGDNEVSEKVQMVS